jgi:hypothetical protein
MGSLFLFISLAVLVGIVGLLAYYFKSRIAEVESKNLKSLEIIEGMYSQQQQMKQYILGGGLKQQQQQQQKQDSSQYDERIKIVLEEEEEESDEEEEESDEEEVESDEEEEESDDEYKTEVKKIAVDMSFPIECELDIDEEEPEYIPEDEPEVNIDGQLNPNEEIIVNKLDEAEHDEAEHDEAEHDEAEHDEAEHDEAKHDDTKHYEAKHDNDDIDFEITAVNTNDKNNYKKMSITVLKNVLHSRGIITDSAKLNKMKKSEIIDLLLFTSLAQ